LSSSRPREQRWWTNYARRSSRSKSAWCPASRLLGSTRCCRRSLQCRQRSKNAARDLRLHRRRIPGGAGPCRGRR